MNRSLRCLTRQAAIEIFEENVIEPAQGANSSGSSRAHWTRRLGPWGVYIDNLLIQPNAGAYISPNTAHFVGQWYWDTLPIVAGALTVDSPRLTSVCVSMVENLFRLLSELGLVPNAADTAHSSRSQPPVLTSLVWMLANQVFARRSADARFEWLMRGYLNCRREYREAWMAHARVEGFVWFDTAREIAGNGTHNSALQAFRPESRSDARVIQALLECASDLPQTSETSRADHIDPRLVPVLDRLNSTQRLHLVNWLHSRRLMVASGMDFSATYGLKELPASLRAILNCTLLEEEDLVWSAIDDVIPVDLNALLYKYCTDCSAMLTAIGKARFSANMPESLDFTEEREFWKNEQRRIAGLFAAQFWDNEAGLYCHYDFRRQCRVPTYPHLASLAYPLWAGVAVQSHAQRLIAHIESLITPWGVKMSHVRTGCQWDWNMWPLPVWLAAEGAARYGFHECRARIANGFVRCVEKCFSSHGSIFEKYNAETGSLDTEGRYPAGEAFSWGAAVYLLLLRAAPETSLPIESGQAH